MPDDKKKKKREKKEVPPWEQYDFTGKEKKPLLKEADTSTPEPPLQSSAEETVRRLKGPKGPAEEAGDVAEEITTRNRVLGAIGTALRGEQAEPLAGEQAEGLSPEEKKKKKKKR